MDTFPPSGLAGSDVSFGGPELILLGILVACLIATIKSRSVTTCVVLFLIGLQCAQESYNAMQPRLGLATPIPLWSNALQGTIAITAGIGIVLNLLHEEKRRRKFAALMLSSPLALIILTPLFACHNQSVYRRNSCKNNIKQIGLGMHNHHDVFDAFPAAASRGGLVREFERDKVQKPLMSWRVKLLPYIDQQELFAKYDSDSPWNEGVNADLRKHLVQEYSCKERPTQFNDDGDFLTAYSVPTGPGTLFGSGDSGPSWRNIGDGTSATILVMEVCGTQIPWSAPIDVNSESNGVAVNQPNETPYRSDSMTSSFHYSGVNVGLADGSARFLNSNTDPVVLQAMLSPNGGD